MLVVLVGLDGDAGEGRVARDVVGLPQKAVPGAEAAGEELVDVDLAAGGRQRQEIEVVDVDVPRQVRLRVLGPQHEHVVELLGPLGAVFEHRAHRGVAVDVGVLPLDVVLVRRLVGELLIGLHEAGVHIAHAGALRAVEDELLGGAGVAVVHERALHRVLDLLDRGALVPGLLEGGGHLLRQRAGHLVIAAAQRLRRLEDRGRDLVEVEQDAPAVALYNRLYHSGYPPVILLSPYFVVFFFIFHKI